MNKSRMTHKHTLFFFTLAGFFEFLMNVGAGLHFLNIAWCSSCTFSC